MLEGIVIGVAFAVLAAAPAAQEGFSLFTANFPPEEFAARRAKIYDTIGG